MLLNTLARNLWVMVAATFIIGANPLPAQEGGGLSDWAFCTALTVDNHFLSFYLPHGKALLAAEANLLRGAKAEQAVEGLEDLPGVVGVLVADSRGVGVFENPVGVAPLDELVKALLGESTLFKTFKSPMMHKLLGGKCRFRQIEAGTKKFDLMVRAFQPVPDDTTQRVVVALILDKDWLTKQIPSQMDSLARESAQILFWGPSPTNSLYVQTLGIVDGKDTLWWQGPKDVKVPDQQALWPFESIEIHTRLEKAK